MHKWIKHCKSYRIVWSETTTISRKTKKLRTPTRSQSSSLSATDLQKAMNLRDASNTSHRVVKVLVQVYDMILSEQGIGRSPKRGTVSQKTKIRHGWWYPQSLSLSLHSKLSLMIYPSTTSSGPFGTKLTRIKPVSVPRLDSNVDFLGESNCKLPIKIPSLKLTASLPLKMDGKGILSRFLLGLACFQGRLLLVSGRVEDFIWST